MASAQAFLKLAIGQLEELPNRLTFCKQRISQAEKLAKLGAGASQGKKEDAEKLITEYLRAADELRTNCQVGGWETHWEALSSGICIEIFLSKGIPIGRTLIPDHEHIHPDPDASDLDLDQQRTDSF